VARHEYGCGPDLSSFAILKTDGDGFHVQGRHDVPANFEHQVPTPVLLLHVQVVEASYMDTNVVRRQASGVAQPAQRFHTRW
jgi:hypothetical protein